MKLPIMGIAAGLAVMALAGCDPTKPPPPTAQEIELQRQLAAQQEQNRLEADRLRHCGDALAALMDTAEAGVPALDADLWRSSKRTVTRHCDERREATEDGNRQIAGAVADLDTIEPDGEG